MFFATRALLAAAMVVLLISSSLAAPSKKSPASQDTLKQYTDELKKKSRRQCFA